MSPNIVASQITKSERWTKLYRTIHHLFLKDEFVHIEDYNKMVQEMNARILQVETNANASIATAVAQITATVVGHTHPSPPAPVNPVVTGPGVIIVPPVVTPPPPAPAVVPVTIAMQRTDAQYISMGPALAPLSSGISPDQLTANTTILSDIGAV
jgi:hypothetical protein